MDDISAFYFLLPSCTSDVIVQYGLNANSPEAAKRELSHLIVKKEVGKQLNCERNFFAEAQYFSIEL